MMKTLVVLCTLCIIVKSFENKNIALESVYNGLIKNINYISNNKEKMNVDCILGIIFAEVFLRDASKYDHNSISSLLKGMSDIIRDTQTRFMKDSSTHWIAENILNDKIWTKKVQFKNGHFANKNLVLSTDFLQNIFNDDISENISTDYCLKNIINNTIKGQNNSYDCHLDPACLDTYINDIDTSSGYITTHKLLLLQFLRARRCLINEKVYEYKTTKLCFHMYEESSNAEYYGKLDEIFDLFLEQTVLCVYEGFEDFLKESYLTYILKTQKDSGCFAAFSGMNLGNRPKRNIRYLEDGCADHTTGLGTAVLSLYYNYLIKEIN